MRPTPGIAFRESFDCLWCGTAWTVREADDLEGWSQLCPTCLGKAGENPFLRRRLRAAIADRGAARAAAMSSAAGASPEQAASEMLAYDRARAAEDDDWYLRRGRYERGPVHDTAWAAELDTAGRWLDALPVSGRIVELAAGTGWWSPLLAGKGELWAYDPAPEALDRARDRLLAHGLRAHLHLRDAWADPDGPPADAVFCGFWLSHVARDRLGAFLGLVHRWLRPGGRFAFIDSLPDEASGAVDHPAVEDDIAVRRLDDGREFRVIKVHRSGPELAGALREAGFRDVDVTTSGRFFVLGTAIV
ncbi:MAG TPA: class I SAM-dependent methyltransferase [Candidatus Limnocylindrales bacterium]